jgi:predicted dienelactone hydrolase
MFDRKEGRSMRAHCNRGGAALAAGCPTSRALRAALLAVALLLHGIAGCGGGGSDSVDRIVAPPDPLVTGPYPVGVTRVELYDESRDRTLVTEVWYPAAEAARDLPPAPVASYIPPEFAALAEFFTLQLAAVRDVPLAEGGPFPLVEFSHGNGSVGWGNSFQMEHLASHGFIVAAPDHPGNNTYEDSGTEAEHMVHRPLDMRFVADEMVRLTNEAGSPFEGWVDTGRGFGITGHSFGAFAALAAASADERFVAVLPLASGGPVSDSYAAATLFLLATEDHAIGFEGNQEIRAAFAETPRPRFIGEVVDAGHFSFGFFCQTTFGIGDGDGCNSGTRLEDGSPLTFVSYRRVWDLVNGYSAALFGRYLKGIREYDEVLASNLDPEIVRYTAEPGD